MQAGKLNHRATFQRQDEARDKYANVSQDWADFLTVWSNVRETTGKERVAGGSVENNRTATMRIRGSSEARGVTEADRVKVRAAVWRIRGVANADDRGAFIDLLLEIDPTATAAL